INGLVKRFQEAQERKRAILADIYSLFLETFDVHSQACWKICISIIVQIDCLYALAKASSTYLATSEQICMHEIISTSYSSESSDSGVAIRQSTHPCVPNCIPNDVAIGIQEAPPMILLTGPNMGGKSTMLRQVCIQVILAQLGCYCPASSLQLKP